MPNMPKVGYQTVPTWSEIQQMTDDQLRNVADFTILNSHGQIQFIGNTDLTDVDLADAVNINECEAEVYDEKKMGSRYPKVGEKLNRPALISFFDVKKPDNVTMEKFIDRLSKIASQRDVSILALA